MKKIFVISMMVLFGLSMVPVQAMVKEEPLIKDLRETKKEVKADKKELKTERAALRKPEGSDVGLQTRNSFYADFAEIPNVKWKRIDNFDEARFIKDGKEMTAFYDDDSKLVGTTQNKTFVDVPAKGQKEIKAKYKDYMVGPVVFFDDNEVNETDMIMYGFQFDDEDNYFVELTKGNSKIVVRVNAAGMVYFFKEL